MKKIVLNFLVLSLLLVTASTSFAGDECRESKPGSKALDSLFQNAPQQISLDEVILEELLRYPEIQRMFLSAAQRAYTQELVLGCERSKLPELYEILYQTRFGKNRLRNNEERFISMLSSMNHTLSQKHVHVDISFYDTADMDDWGSCYAVKIEVGPSY